MELKDLLTPNQVEVCTQADINKKQLFDIVARLITARNSEIQPQTITRALQDREKIGSTNMGHGIAIPHARVKDIDGVYLAVVLLKQPLVDYDDSNNPPVSLVFALIVPEDAQDAHVKILAQIARHLKEPTYAQRLRSAQTSVELYKATVDDLTVTEKEETSDVDKVH